MGGHALDVRARLKLLITPKRLQLAQKCLYATKASSLKRLSLASSAIYKVKDLGEEGEEQAEEEQQERGHGGSVPVQTPTRKKVAQNH